MPHSDEFKFAAFDASSVMKTGFTSLNFKVGLTMQKSWSTGTLTEVAQREEDRLISKA